MGGVALIAGPRTSDPVAGMLAALTAGTRPSHRESLAGDGVIGGTWHQATPGGRRPAAVDGFVVAFDGEVYDGRLAAEAFAAMVCEQDFRELASVNGSFAAVVGDRKTGTVTLIADRLASRPLYFWQDGARIAVASRMRSLFADPRVPRRLLRSGLVEMLAHQRTFGAATLFADVEGLVAGEVVTLAPGRAVHREQRARPRFQPLRTNPRDYQAALTEALRGAVERRIADGTSPLLLLSGGFDSRVVAASATALGRSIRCATVGSWENREVTTARAVAAAAGHTFDYIRMTPAAVAAGFDAAVAATDGAHTAPPSLTPAYPSLAAAGAAALLNGHLLDIFFRGTYLPKRSIPLGRSRAALPRLRAHIDPAPEAVSATHHIRTEWPLAEAVLEPATAREFRALAAAGVARALDAVDLGHPADAHHAFVLHALARHTSHGDFVAATQHMEFRTPALDSAILDLYFALPAQWRAARIGVGKAAAALAPALFRLPDVNTRHRADWPYALQLMGAIGEAALRRVVARSPALPDPIFTEGSWLNWCEFLRREPSMRRRIEALPESAALLDTGLFRRDGLREVVADHIEGRRAATKLLMVLATLDSWLRQTGYTAVVP